MLQTKCTAKTAGSTFRVFKVIWHCKKQMEEEWSENVTDENHLACCQSKNRDR